MTAMPRRGRRPGEGRSAGVMPAAERSTLLPWERADGKPLGAGICLSGGGLRAAAFSLGVMQALQDERGLVYGPGAASNLSAVSGGSYTAAAIVLGGRNRVEDPSEYQDGDPLAHGSPEERHILANGNYLKPGIPRILGLIALNLVALAALFVWTGTMLADAAVIPTLIDVPPEMSWVHDTGFLLGQLPIWLLAVTMVGSYWLALRIWYGNDAYWARMVTGLLFLVVGVLAGKVIPVVAVVSGWHVWAVGLPLVAVIGFTVASWLAEKLRVGGLPALAINAGAVWSPRILGVGLLVVTSAWWHQLLAEPDLRDDASALGVLLLFFGSLSSGWIFSYVSHRASLHREYRSLLSSCFCVVRAGNKPKLIADPLLSSTAPPSEPNVRYPRLLVSATANARPPLTGAKPFVPFVLSHDVCGAPGYDGAVFSTKQLELIQAPAALFRRGREPLVSLFTAVAATGAAVSPSMGRFTTPSLRMVFAAFNVRLGRWLPNVFKPDVRRAVEEMEAPKPLPTPTRLGPGYDELVPELAGLEGPRMYVSDGGHFDNLGLLALLRTRCADIWCVDSSPERDGMAVELDRVLRIAREDMKVETEVDTKGFKAGGDGLYGSTHVVGRIRYTGGTEARLLVLKLGLTSESPAPLLDRRTSDPGFPHHATFTHQFYDEGRMDAYRQLGWDVARRCLADPRAAAPT